MLDVKPSKFPLPAVDIQRTTCLKKLTTTYGSMSAVFSPMKAFVTLAMMLELLRGRPSARYTLTQKRAQGRSEGKPSGISRFLRKQKPLQQHVVVILRAWFEDIWTSLGSWKDQADILNPVKIIHGVFEKHLLWFTTKLLQESKNQNNFKTLQWPFNPTSSYKTSHAVTVSK